MRVQYYRWRKFNEKINRAERERQLLLVGYCKKGRTYVYGMSRVKEQKRESEKKNKTALYPV